MGKHLDEPRVGGIVHASVSLSQEGPARDAHRTVGVNEVGAGQATSLRAPRFTVEEARAFLEPRYGRVEGVEQLGGGFWSAAFGFVGDGRELVIRFGTDRSWLEAEQKAMAFSSPALPVPEVVEIGTSEGGVFAVSQRHHGIFLESVSPGVASRAGPMLLGLLEALFSVPKSADLPIGWQWSPPTAVTWRQWLRETLDDRPDREMRGGWRGAVRRADPALDRIGREAEARLAELVDACPERRDLVHRDLLHGNVLVAEDGSKVNAVFSWKCSVRADFLYDVAWCTFWGPFHPGVAATDPWGLVQSSDVIRADASALTDAAARHHCYELHIGIEHLAFNAWTGDAEALGQTGRILDEVLERGPLAEA